MMRVFGGFFANDAMMLTKMTTTGPKVKAMMRKAACLFLKTAYFQLIRVREMGRLTSHDLTTNPKGKSSMQGTELVLKALIDKA
jgi:hypothetical protein